MSFLVLQLRAGKFTNFLCLPHVFSPFVFCGSSSGCPGLVCSDPCDRDVWRSSARSAMRAAGQLPGKEPTDVDDAPASAC